MRVRQLLESLRALVESDVGTRSLERRFKATHDPADLWKWIRALIREGRLEQAYDIYFPALSRRAQPSDIEDQTFPVSMWPQDIQDTLKQFDSERTDRKTLAARMKALNLDVDRFASWKDAFRLANKLGKQIYVRLPGSNYHGVLTGQIEDHDDYFSLPYNFAFPNGSSLPGDGYVSSASQQKHEFSLEYPG